MLKWEWSWGADTFMKVEEILNGLKTQTLGRTIFAYPTIGSTNDEAKRLAAEGAPEGTLVIAEEQTAGRGRLGRRWLAPAGTALLFSLVLRPPLPPDRAAQVTMAVALGAAEAIEAETGLPVQLKWPNDLLIRGRKAGGLLTETSVVGDRLEWVVVGLGLNVNLDFTAPGLEALAGQATSLSLELGLPVDRVRLLQALLLHAEAHLALVYKGHSLHHATNKRLAYRGEPVVVEAPSGRLTGTIVEVDARGWLRLQQADGTMAEIAVGDVYHVKRG